MAQIKIAVVGAGSFVFGPSVLQQAFRERQLNGIELALMDVDADIVEGMAGVGRRMAREAGLDSVLTVHTTLPTALDGADFVICCAARQMQRRYALDCEIIDTYLPGHLVTEFGGIAGISYSLRQIALIQEIAAQMRKSCPNAWLLSVSNPLPRVCQAAHEEGIYTAGFCSVSASILGALWKLFQGESLDYPWTPAEQAYEVTIAGVNHCSFLLGVRDRKTGEDLLPALRAKLAQGATLGSPRCERMARETGYLLLPNDRHTADFLEPDGTPFERENPYHGSAEERMRRLTVLREISAGTQPYGDLLQHPSWEHPIDWIAALVYGTPTTLHTVSLINSGQITNLPTNIFAETGCTVTSEGVQPERVTLPDSILPLCLRTAQVTDTIVQAARTHSRKRVHEAVERDPTVLDKAAGFRAIDACLKAHADILPDYR